MSVWTHGSWGSARRGLAAAAWLAAWAATAGAAGGALAREPGDAEAAVEAPAAGEGGLESLSLEDLLSIRVATVRAASKRSEKATQAPATVVVVTREQIRLRGYAFLRDVLHDLPGFETVETFFSESGTQVAVRGIAGNNKVIVLVDGVRVNPPGGEPMMFRSDISLRHAEAVEIVYGPGSTLYGQDAISAVINVRTRPPDARGWADVGAAGGWPLRYELWAGGARAFEHVAVQATAQVYRAELTDLSRVYRDEWRATYRPVAATKTTGPGDDRGLDDTRWDFGLNAMLRLDIDNASLTVWHRQSARSSSEGLDGGFAKIEAARWGDLSTVVEARGAASLGEGLELNAALHVNRYEIDPRSRYVFAVSDTAWFDDDYKYGIGLGAGVEVQLDAELGPRVRLNTGVSASHFDIQPKATIPGGAHRSKDVLAQAGAFEYYTVQGDPTSRRTAARAANLVYQGVGTYAEAAVEVARWLRVIAGLRLDYDTRIDDLPVSPRLALVLAPRPELAVKAIYTRAYVAPPAYFSHNVFFNGTSLNVANDDLKPERAQSLELAASWTDELYAVGLSLYYNRQSSLLVTGDRQLSVNVVAPEVWLSPDATEPVVLTHSANSGDTRALGGELRGRAMAGRSVSLWGSWSFVDVRATTRDGGATTHQGLSGLSRHNLRLGATVSPVPERLYLSASLSLRSTPEGIPELEDGPRRTTLADEVRVPWELRFHGRVVLREDLDLFVDLRNLTNHRYALAGLLGNAVPQEAFSGMVGLSWHP